MIDPRELEQRIRSALPDAHVIVKDLTGGQDHYDVEVVSELFDGVSAIKRHRMVYAPLKDVMGGELHALKLTTKTPKEVGG